MGSATESSGARIGMSFSGLPSRTRRRPSSRPTAAGSRLVSPRRSPGGCRPLSPAATTASSLMNTVNGISTELTAGKISARSGVTSYSVPWNVIQVVGTYTLSVCYYSSEGKGHWLGRVGRRSQHRSTPDTHPDPNAHSRRDPCAYSHPTVEPVGCRFRCHWQRGHGRHRIYPSGNQCLRNARRHRRVSGWRLPGKQPHQTTGRQYVFDDTRRLRRNRQTDERHTTIPRLECAPPCTRRSASSRWRVSRSTPGDVIPPAARTGPWLRHAVGHHRL